MDRFELETQIMNLHSVVESLQDISTGILEHDITRDEAVNAIMGLSVTTKIKLDKLFDTFTQVFRLDGYRDCVNDLEDCCSECDIPVEWL